MTSKNGDKIQLSWFDRVVAVIAAVVPAIGLAIAGTAYLSGMKTDIEVLKTRQGALVNSVDKMDGTIDEMNKEAIRRTEMLRAEIRNLDQN